MSQNVKETVDLAISIIANSIKKDKKGYYLQENNKKKYIQKDELIESYNIIFSYIEKTEKILRDKDKEYQGKEKSLIKDYITLLQTLRRNLLNNNYDKEISKSLQNLKLVVKNSGYEDVLKNVLDETFYIPPTMVDLYEAGLINIDECCDKIRILSDANTVSTSDILKLEDRDSISSEMIYSMIGENKLLDLYNKNKSAKYINYIPQSVIFNLYLTEEIKSEDLEKSSLNRESIIQLIRNGFNINNVVKILQSDIPNKIIPKGTDIADIFVEGTISKEEFIKIIQIEKIKKDEIVQKSIMKLKELKLLNNKDIFELVTLGIVDEENLIDIYKEQKMIKSYIVFPEAYENEFIKEDEFKEYFNINKILEWKSQGKLNKEFWDFYREITPKTEEIEQWEEKTITNVKNTEDKLENLLMLVKEGIISIESIREELDEEEIIEKAYNIDNNILFRLYDCNILSIEALSIIYDNNLEVIMDACREDKIEESALELMSKAEILNAYKNEQLTDKNMIKAYEYSVIEIEQLQSLNISHTDIASNIDEKFDLIKIEKLFLNRLIDYDSLVELKEKNIISQEEFIKINKKFDFEKAIEEIRNRQIKNEAVAEGKEKSGKKYTVFETQGVGLKKLPAISVESRLEFFNILEAEQPQHIYRSDKLQENKKAALEGYDYIIVKNMGVILLEKLYEDNTTNREIPAVENATYILPPVKLIEYLERSNKKDLRSDSNVRYINHTANWSRNLLKACTEINPELDKRELLQKYKEVNQLIREEYEENVRGE